VPSRLPSVNGTRVPGAGVAEQVAQGLRRQAFRYESSDIPAGVSIDQWRRRSASDD
jgi:hypothetical protein